MARPDESVITDLLELHTWTVFDVDDDGRVLAGSDATGATQVVEIGPDGHRTPLTALPGACSGRYVPGRRTVVVEHDTDGDERSQLSLLHLDPLPSSPVGLDALEPVAREPEFIHALVDVDADRVVYRTNRRNKVDFDVVVHDLATGAERVVYDDGGHVGEVDVDGDTVVVTLTSLQPGSTHVRLVRDGGTVEVTDADEHAMHVSAQLLPGTSTVLMSSNRGRDFRSVVTVDPAGRWTTLLAADDHDVTALPSPDGSRLLVARHVDGADELTIHGPDGEPLVPVVLPGRGVVSTAWSPNAAWLAVALNSPTTPGTVVIVDAAGGTVRTLVDGTAQMSPELRRTLVEPASMRVPTRDGESIPCFVYTPPEPVPELAGSVVVNIHGGPESQARRQFSAVNQALAAAGHVVVVPNVRGSTGYGKRWYSMDDVRLRLESVLDLVDIRSWVPAVRGEPDRVALYGGSYGGYMVLAALSMHPGLWAAGVDIVGMSSLVSFLENTSDYRRAVREREYGSLERDRDFLRAASPLTHVRAMDTPLFVIHGANDPRVPLSESQQIKVALDEKGVTCTLQVYPDEGHGLAKRANRLSAYPAALAFLGEQLRRR
ncbi:dipeptidyl aminopeptidase/acylaminoacyl peptidase [Haloactinopolyspora alba]|uniref:Dipeptidyl aminopeptidase/acylaminoacyl peptidase n=1 Tax=Haloactinopolyspora alba TaxID=648780 RepID=A0A2P8EBM7_9ACTN|nr:alpha/beta fold hydrolase [Haloactinopolyspora alba]PSL06837.1 dipeptidyl aminopeptidase/acylaminoacyl peptidase [Haloactinopolyspora alba]